MINLLFVGSLLGPTPHLQETVRRVQLELTGMPRRLAVTVLGGEDFGPLFLDVIRDTIVSSGRERWVVVIDARSSVRKPLSPMQRRILGELLQLESIVALAVVGTPDGIPLRSGRVAVQGDEELVRWLLAVMTGLGASPSSHVALGDHASDTHDTDAPPPPTPRTGALPPQPGGMGPSVDFGQPDNVTGPPGSAPTLGGGVHQPLGSLPVQVSDVVLGDAGDAAPLAGRLLKDDDEEWEPLEHDAAEVDDEEEEGPHRRVNTGFASLAEPTRPLEAARPLRPGTALFFWVEIGAAAPGAIDVRPAFVPSWLPDGEELVVALFSQPGGFVVPDGEGTLTLGRREAFVRLQPDAEMTLPYPLALTRLFFRVVTPKKSKTYEFRCNLYVRGTLIQSFSVHATVGASPHPGPFLETKLDYVICGSLRESHVARLGEHRLSILSNDTDGTHGFRFYGGPGARGTTQLDTHEIEDVLTQARRAYRRVSWGSDEPFAAAQHRYRYATPGDYARLEGDLIDLARTGFRLWSRIAGKLTPHPRAALEEGMRVAGGRIQLALKRTARHVLPAAIFYDHPFDGELARQELALCPEFARTLAEDVLDTTCFQSVCPYHDDPSKVCPSGFWGFRHAIGVPISAENDAEIVLEIAGYDLPRFSALLWTGDDFHQRDVHRDDLRRRFQRGYAEAVTRDDALALLATGNAHVVYFYCHGGVDADQNPFLRVGSPSDAPIAVSTFAAKQILWNAPHPLVFINGCHTTDAEPTRAIQFVDELVHDVGALGVIGTEITVFEPLAVRMATAFFRYLDAGLNVGEAVRRARLELLGAELNPLGLVYVPFVHTTVRLRGGVA